MLHVGLGAIDKWACGNAVHPQRGAPGTIPWPPQNENPDMGAFRGQGWGAGSWGRRLGGPTQRDG
eukprot:14129988-Alexandrium_andersonii.AAC.1